MLEGHEVGASLGAIVNDDIEVVAVADKQAPVDANQNEVTKSNQLRVPASEGHGEVEVEESRSNKRRRKWWWWLWGGA
jgi:hypothetical protein